MSEGGGVEARLRALWCRVLENEDASEEDFFAQGGAARRSCRTRT
jgi:hypothetical protein